MKENIVKEAEALACKAHSNQFRKNSKEHYINHLISVNETLKKLTDNENILAIGWLHDIIEDTDYEFEDLYDFPVEVLIGLSYETEDKSKDWYTRKISHIKEFNNVLDIHRNILLVAFADKLSNLKDLLKLYKEFGLKEMFKSFNNDNPYEQYWYYNNFYKIFMRNQDLFEKDKSLLEEYKDILSKIWEEDLTDYLFI